MTWALQSNMIKDCPLTAKDMKTATKVWGRNIAMLKGKTVRTVGVYIVMVCPWTDHILARNLLLEVEADLS